MMSNDLHNVENVLKEAALWKHASEKVLRQKGFWPNRLAWRGRIAVGIAFNGSGGDYAVSRALLEHLVAAGAAGDRKCYVALFNRGETRCCGVVEVGVLDASLGGVQPSDGLHGEYWWVSPIDFCASEEI